jgi:hypothetical protein
VPRPGQPIDALLHGGRFREATALIEAHLLAAAAPSAPVDGPPRPGLPDDVVAAALLAAIVMDSWTPAAPLRVATLSHAQQRMYWYVRGVLAARRAWPGGKAELFAEAREAAEQLEALQVHHGRTMRDDVRHVSVRAAMAAAQEERDELALLLAHAASLDAQLRDIGVDDDPLLPLDELSGDLWLQLHRFADARRQYRQTTIRRPERTRAWVGRARAARELGDLADARASADRVLSAWAHADEDLAALGEMREYARLR